MRSQFQLTLQKLEVLCVVAELKSVTRAAAQLYVSQPVVTAHIRGIEEKLGVTLFKRDGRGIALTDDGVRVHKWAQGVVTRTRELERELAGSVPGESGRALLAASMSAGSYLLPPLVCDFHLAHPDGKVQMTISTPQVALESVRSGASDFAVIMLLPDQMLEGLTAEPLWDEPLLLVSAPRSQWVGAEAERDAISRMPFISTYSAVMQQLEEGQVRANGIAPRTIVMELGHPEAQKEAVRRDLGVCFFLLSSVRAEIDRGELRSVKTPSLKLSIPLYLVCRKDKELSLYQRALMEYIRAAHPPGVTSFVEDAGVALS
ncbi:LysR family transcriptional regulator [soil metagenome]